MKVTLERLPESRVLIDIEVDPDRLEKSIEAEYKKFASRARVPGFRPGKAPRAAIERHVGGAKNLRAGLIDDAIQKLVPAVYNDVISEQDIDPIDQPELELVEVDPVRFKATVPVRPSIDLGDYQDIRVDVEPVEVTDEMVQEQVLALQRRNATQVPVDREATWNDSFIASVKGVLAPEEGEEEGEEIVNDEDAEFTLREGTNLLVPGLAEEFLGMKAGETKTVELSFPEDFRAERLAGKPISFTISVKELKEEQLPELDAEFAASVSEEFESYEQLREKIEENLRANLQREADQRYQERALDLLVEGATLEYPKVMVDREIEHIIRDTTGNDAQAYAQYLQSAGRTDEEFRENFRETADERVRRTLALTKLGEVEGIEPTPDEIEAEIEKLIAPMGEDGQRFREMFATDAGKATVSRDLKSRRTMERLVAIASNPEPAPQRPPKASEPEVMEDPDAAANEPVLEEAE